MLSRFFAVKIVIIQNFNVLYSPQSEADFTVSNSS